MAESIAFVDLSKSLVAGVAEIPCNLLEPYPRKERGIHLMGYRKVGYLEQIFYIFKGLVRGFIQKVKNRATNRPRA